jgi:3-oxoacyl-[acyl-carrier protein] reductase
MDFDFTGKTAIVTGGSRGIGRSISSLLIDNDCNVIYTGTHSFPNKEIKGGQYEQLILSNESSCFYFIENVIKKTTKIDILINNAGINIIDSISDINYNDWAKILQVNLTGAMLMMREVSKIMKNNNHGGKILNISSIFGVVSKEKRAAYSASKTALIGITRSSALDLAQYNIMVNALCPGFTETELTSSILSSEEKEQIRKAIPLQRFADVSEIAKTVIFLCSDFNSYMTGQTLIVDGGFLIQ